MECFQWLKTSIKTVQKKRVSYFQQNDVKQQDNKQQDLLSLKIYQVCNSIKVKYLTKDHFSTLPYI